MSIKLRSRPGWTHPTLSHSQLQGGKSEGQAGRRQHGAKTWTQSRASAGNKAASDSGRFHIPTQSPPPLPLTSFSGPPQELHTLQPSGGRGSRGPTAQLAPRWRLSWLPAHLPPLTGRKKESWGSIRVISGQRTLPVK